MPGSNRFHQLSEAIARAIAATGVEVVHKRARKAGVDPATGNPRLVEEVISTPLASVQPIAAVNYLDIPPSLRAQFQANTLHKAYILDTEEWRVGDILEHGGRRFVVKYAHGYPTHWEVVLDYA